MIEFRGFLDALGAQTRLDVAEAAASGGCTLEFDGGLEVTFELASGERAVHVYAAILTLAPGAGREPMLATVLQLHLFGMATQDCYFGLDAQHDRLILFKTVDLALHDEGSALQAVENLVNQAERWKVALQEFAQKAGKPDAQGDSRVFHRA